MTPDEMQDHIEEIAGRLGCKVIQEPGMTGMMYVEYEPPTIEGPIITNQKDYMVMLHELGHVHYGHTQGRPPYEDRTYYFDNGVLRSEAEAWEYALDVVDPTMTMDYTTRRFMWERCMNIYYLGAKLADGRPGQRLSNGNRHHHSFTWDEPDEYFWSIKERMLDFYGE